jgi:hypothetical protein
MSRKGKGVGVVAVKFVDRVQHRGTPVVDGDADAGEARTKR